jgi:hypothetical protein
LAQRVVESERGKRLREDSLMLVRGLDSVAASLAQLSDTLTAAQKVSIPPSRLRFHRPLLRRDTESVILYSCSRE